MYSWYSQSSLSQYYLRFFRQEKRYVQGLEVMLLVGLLLVSFV